MQLDKEIYKKPTIEKKFELKEGGHYLAVFAAFRDLDHAQWKVFFEVQPTTNEPYKVILDNSSLAIEK